MEDKFNDYIEGLESHKWFGVSERTVFQWLKDKKIEGVKWKNRRLINVPSVFGYLLKKKVIEVSQIKQQELKRELELKEFQK